MYQVNPLMSNEPCYRITSYRSLHFLGMETDNMLGFKELETN